MTPWRCGYLVNAEPASSGALSEPQVFEALLQLPEAGAMIELPSYFITLMSSSIRAPKSVPSGLGS